MSGSRRARLSFVVAARNAARVAACANPEDAAAIVALYGDGATVRFGRRIVWREGSESVAAAASYDAAASIMLRRIAS